MMEETPQNGTEAIAADEETGPMSLPTKVSAIGRVGERQPSW
jgi:hypothetical protein